MQSAIIVFVLALTAQLVVATALLTYVRSVLFKLERELSATYLHNQGTLTTSFEQLRESIRLLQDRVKVCELGLSRTEGTHLQGELAALDADVKALAASVRKQFGRVWGNRGAERADDGPDDDLGAMLALQGAK